MTSIVYFCISGGSVVTLVVYNYLHDPNFCLKQQSIGPMDYCAEYLKNKVL